MTNPLGGTAIDGLVRSYLQHTPRLAPYRKTIANVAALAVALATFLVSVPAEWLPPEVAAGIAFGVWAVGAVVSYLVPNAITPTQGKALEEYAETYGRHAKRDGATGPDGIH
jgi:hypothetical protein